MPRITEDQYFALPDGFDVVPRMAECLKCCAMVRYTETALEVHKTSHLYFDELVEWARAVDNKLFPRPIPQEPNEDLFTGPGYEAHPGHDHEDCCK